MLQNEKVLNTHFTWFKGWSSKNEWIYHVMHKTYTPSYQYHVYNVSLLNKVYAHQNIFAAYVLNP